MVMISAQSTKAFSRLYAAQRRGNRDGIFRKVLGRFIAIIVGITIIYNVHNATIRRKRPNFKQGLPSNHNQITKVDNSDKPCALLFFGLVKDFKDLSLPAVQRNIIGPNPHCDIFLHTFDINEVPENKRNNERNNAKINPREAYLLTDPDHVNIESVASFELRRGDLLKHSRKHFHKGWGECCVSHDNMIKQWHSIAGAWDLMREHEKKKLAQLNSKDGLPMTNKNHYYQQVGLFRSDVYQVDPIDIFNSNAAVPNFANNEGYNDRIFYGSYQNAALWADRFGFAPIFEDKYMFSKNRWNMLLKSLGLKKGHDGYHSEYILWNVMHHHNIQIDQRDICMWRIRNGKRLQVTDCGGGDSLKKFQAFGPHGYTFAPDGYLRDKRVNEFTIWAGHWSDLWDDPLREDDEENTLKVTSASAQDSSLDPAIFVLGMFQSGGSLLSGLLDEGYGFYAGNSNDKFELKTMTSQNDAFLWGNGVSWNGDVSKYSNDLSQELIKNETLPTACGAGALTQMREQTGVWVVNDPRLSITLKTWLPLLETKPVVVYTYRDPLEVAMLLREEHGYDLGKGLLLWILYNKLAIQNSTTDVCRVTTSNHAMIADPVGEVERILDEVKQCGLRVYNPGKRSNQHNLNSILKKQGIPVKLASAIPNEVESIGGCSFHKYEPRDGAVGFIEASLYSRATKVYCDLEEGLAYNKNYVWPEITEEERALYLELDQFPVEIEKHLRIQYHKCRS